MLYGWLILSGSCMLRWRRWNKKSLTCRRSTQTTFRSCWRTPINGSPRWRPSTAARRRPLWVHSLVLQHCSMEIFNVLHSYVASIIQHIGSIAKLLHSEIYQNEIEMLHICTSDFLIKQMSISLACLSSITFCFKSSAVIVKQQDQFQNQITRNYQKNYHFSSSWSCRVLLYSNENICYNQWSWLHCTLAVLFTSYLPFCSV